MAEGLLKKLKLSKEPEGDSQMSPATESSQGEGSDAMFPASNDAPALPNLHTPTSNQQAAGELSPPYSQDQPDANSDEAMDLTGGEPAWDMSNQTMNPTHSNGGRSEFAKSAEAQHLPGQSWDNPKARDEYQRQWNGLLDKNFSLRRFGDPFDDDQAQGGK